MFNKILIANRGEIACRVIKTAKLLGVSTVAVYSDADKNALHVRMADEAVYIGRSPAGESYLVKENIINAALKTGAKAIHPGYGFLSENAEFSALCNENGIEFIGPPASAIAAMGSKSAAKKLMGDAEVPLVPGYHGDNQDPEFLKAQADDMGYPVLLKAAAGGGGRGMRPVYKSDEFFAALNEAKRESMSSFGDDQMLIEKYLALPRHVEVQVFCDKQGSGVYLGDRDCSIQRRHQKVVEEAPAPNLSDATRKAMGEAAVRAATAIDYVGAGTIEFLYEEQNGQPHFYFMEMNTRLQVEHPVTEKITGQDLVEWQLRVAAGEPLPLSQNEINTQGHAVEVRIYAEDPSDNFCPSTGQLKYLSVPEESAHVRVDTGVVQGDSVSPFYDPMIAKLITWDEDRDLSIRRMQTNLKAFKLAGLESNIAFLQRIIHIPAFAESKLDTHFIDRYADELFDVSKQVTHQDILLAALYLLLRRNQKNNRLRPGEESNSPWLQSDSWRMNQARLHKGTLTILGSTFDIVAKQFGFGDSEYFDINIDDKSSRVSGNLDGTRLYADIDGYRLDRILVDHGDETHFSLISEQGNIEFELASPDYGEVDSESEGSLNAPMNGRILEVLVNPGDSVEKSQPLIVMEAMKMEHTISAPSSGVVDAIYCKDDDLVDGGAVLLSLNESEEQ